MANPFGQIRCVMRDAGAGIACAAMPSIVFMNWGKIIRVLFHGLNPAGIESGSDGKGAGWKTKKPTANGWLF
ncbi:hypothetical protein [Janthinobacterium sp.]|uniref:hypothetical protein n=1 Tax=Janthinobacterium sp. TaxID=1871054 RepID=UPI00258C80F0|nr:hypothetical protein [Janthinobacterium sp.]MCX7293979.1 hypothetical protein [Janthinobacterium sp.]